MIQIITKKGMNYTVGIVVRVSEAKPLCVPSSQKQSDEAGEYMRVKRGKGGEGDVHGQHPDPVQLQEWDEACSAEPSPRPSDQWNISVRSRGKRCTHLRSKGSWNAALRRE